MLMMREHKILGITAVIATLVILISANCAGPSLHAQATSPAAETLSSEPRYETRKVHDPNGTGRFYMGREIAQVMGPGGISWLDRPQRDEEQKPEVAIAALGLHGGETVVDLGAGSGYFTFRIAPLVGKTGRVLAVDVQDEMLNTLRERAAAQKITNVVVVKGSESDPSLPVNAVDVVLMVDVYHELAYPFEIMTKVRQALKPHGRMVFVEYRKEDPKVDILAVHKMSVAQLEKEMNAVGFVRVQTIETLPVQHIVIFEKKP
jgi:ubiquinone/menaquinone biosynthesis C-methylase UbiE